MTGQEYIEAFRGEGRVEGMETLVVRLIERRLQRPLAAAERVTLHERVAALGAEHVGDLVIDLSPDGLAAWLAEAASAA